MSRHSVPCWCFLDKDGAVFASGYSSVHFSAPLFPHLGFVLRQYPDNDLTRSPWSSAATREVSAKPDHLLFGKTICRNNLKSPRFLPLVSPMQSSIGVLTFEVQGAHFRGTDTYLLGQISLSFILKRLLSSSLTMRKPSNGVGAHFRSAGCSLSRYRVLTFEVQGAHFRGAEIRLIDYISVG